MQKMPFGDLFLNEFFEVRGNHMGFMSIVQQIIGVFGTTLFIFFCTLLFSMPLGILFALARMSKFKPLNIFMQVCISILRGTPLMLQLIVVFFMPYYVFGIKLSTGWRVYAALIGFSINYAAYFGEIFRAGIQAVPVGQHEAAEVLGFTKTQTFFKIVFPQMVKRVVPPVTNEVITLVKDTSMAFAIAYAEMFTMAKQVAAQQSNIMPLFVAGLFYYIFNIVVAWVMGRVEKKLSYFE